MRKSLLALILFALGTAREAEQPGFPIVPRKRNADGSDVDPEYPYDDNDPGVDVDLDPNAQPINADGTAPIVSEILYCPQCRVRHIDAGEWKYKPHRKHLCLECGTVWQPRPFFTRGV